MPWLTSSLASTPLDSGPRAIPAIHFRSSGTLIPLITYSPIATTAHFSTSCFHRRCSRPRHFNGSNCSAVIMPASSKTQGSKKVAAGRLAWNTDLRLALLLLKEEFNCSDRKVARTLPLIFKDHFRSCGVTEPTLGSIVCQASTSPIDSAHTNRNQIV